MKRMRKKVKKKNGTVKKKWSARFVELGMTSVVEKNFGERPSKKLGMKERMERLAVMGGRCQRCRNAKGLMLRKMRDV